MIATTIGACGWAVRDDRPCLDLLLLVCDVFVTTDQILPFQQRLDNRSFATIVLIAPPNRLAAILPLISGLHFAIDEARPGSVVRVTREKNVASFAGLIAAGGGHFLATIAWYGVCKAWA